MLHSVFLRIGILTNYLGETIFGLLLHADFQWGGRIGWIITTFFSGLVATYCSVGLAYVAVTSDLCLLVTNFHVGIGHAAFFLGWIVAHMIGARCNSPIVRHTARQASTINWRRRRDGA